MKKRKNIVSIILIIICISIIIYLGVFYNKKENTKKNESLKNYLVMDNFANLAYSQGTWRKVSIQEIEQSEKKYETYSKNQYLGQNSLKYGNVWNVFNQNQDYVDYVDYLFAYSSNFNMIKKDTNIRNINDQEKNEMMNHFKQTDFNDILSNEVIDIDLDNDGINDRIVCVSNMGASKNDKEKYYNLVYIALNDKIIQIINENSTNYDILRTGIYNLSYMFSQGTKNYIVLKKTIGVISDSPTEEVFMYEYTDINKIKKVKIIE